MKKDVKCLLDGIRPSHKQNYNKPYANAVVMLVDFLVLVFHYCSDEMYEHMRHGVLLTSGKTFITINARRWDTMDN